MRSHIQPMKKIAQTLRSHRELLLNNFRAKRRLSSGVVESLNKQGQTDHEKIVWLPHVPDHANCVVSCHDKRDASFCQSLAQCCPVAVTRAKIHDSG
jgi:Transposase